MSFLELRSVDLAPVRDIYEAAFPRIERRPFENLCRAARERENACAEGILCDGELIGFVFFWRFTEPVKFIFGEYIVIAPCWQGRRVGESVVRTLLAREGVPLVFETEPPETETARRRIAFHERLGAQLWDATYIQPTYHADLPWTPMYLYVNGEIDDEYRDAVREKIHREVYNVTPDYECRLRERMRASQKNLENSSASA